MKFSAQDEYGLRILMQLGRAYPDGSLTIPEVSRLEGLTQPNAAKILTCLRRSGLVRSTRGQTGGYTLAKAPSRILVGDALEALGGRLIQPDFCEKHVGGLEACIHSEGCNLRPLWKRVQAAVDQIVFSITLDNLLTDEPEGREWIRLQALPDRPKPVAMTSGD